MTKQIKTIGIIGAGNMGQAIINGLKRANCKENIFVFEKDIEKSAEVAGRLKVKETNSVEHLIRQANAVIICVKPQDIDDVLEAAAGLNLQGKLLISIAAGISTSYILKKIKTKAAVIRVMPNMNVFVGMGVNAIAKGKHASESDVRTVEKIFATVGKNFILPEKKIDAVTALSGSGPAYAALFIKAMCDAAVKNGLPKASAEKIVIQTLRGTLEMIEKCGIAPVDFMKKVMSKGGTTEAAFRVLDGAGFEKIILDAISSACNRSKELGRK